MVVRTYGGVGPEERKAERRKRLLDAALVVFGEHGFHQATVRQVCVEARLTERYFYESFKSMGELFTTLYAQLDREMMDATIAALAGSAHEPMALAEAALRAFFSYIQHNPARARVLLIDALTVNARTVNAANDVVRDYSDLVRQFVKLFYPDLPALKIELGLAVAGLVGATIHIATHWARGGFKKPLEQVVDNGMMQFRGLNLWYLQRKSQQAAADAAGETSTVGAPDTAAPVGDV